MNCSDTSDILAPFQASPKCEPGKSSGAVLLQAVAVLPRHSGAQPSCRAAPTAASLHALSSASLGCCSLGQALGSFPYTPVSPGLSLTLAQLRVQVCRSTGARAADGGTKEWEALGQGPQAVRWCRLHCLVSLSQRCFLEVPRSPARVRARVPSL